MSALVIAISVTYHQHLDDIGSWCAAAFGAWYLQFSLLTVLETWQLFAHFSRCARSPVFCGHEQCLIHMSCCAAEFGAWYPRFSPVTAVRTWRNFVTDMKELFSERLRNSPASVLWRAYSPSHFGGELGTYEIVGTPDEWPDSQLTSCQPASKGGWCSHYCLVSPISVTCFSHCCYSGMLCDPSGRVCCSSNSIIAFQTSLT